MRIAEIFRSIQGEGRLTGAESVFIRTCGCNLRCRYCDTRYGSWAPEGEDLSIDEVLAQVERLAAQSPAAEDAGTQGAEKKRIAHVVLTGGEPMLFAELIPLAAGLRRGGMHITIETAGTLYLPVACDLMSISPKLSNSTPQGREHAGWTVRHERNRHAPEVIRRLIAEYDYQVKFVVDRPADCDEVERYLAEFPEIERGRVMLMPQGTCRDELQERERWLRPYCAAHDLQYCPRRQIEWFGPVRGT